MARVDIRSLDVSMLRTFDALLAERSVSRAAARLFLSQPAVSTSLKRLREVFDDPLFTRTAHGVEPTARALALAPHVHTVLSELGRLLSAGRDFDPAASTRVFRILGSDNMSVRVLPSLCRELLQCGSGIRILWEQPNYGARERLQRGDADLGLLPGLTPPTGLIADLLYEDHYVMVAPRGKFSGKVTLADFCATPHVFLGYGRSAVEDTVDQIVAKAGLRRYPQVAVSTFSQMAHLVAGGEHVAVFPARIAARYADVLDTHPLPLELPSYGLYMCCNLRGEADPGLQWLRESVARILRQPSSQAPQ